MEADRCPICKALVDPIDMKAHSRTHTGCLAAIFTVLAGMALTVGVILWVLSIDERLHCLEHPEQVQTLDRSIPFVAIPRC